MRGGVWCECEVQTALVVWDVAERARRCEPPAITVRPRVGYRAAFELSGEQLSAEAERAQADCASAECARR